MATPQPPTISMTPNTPKAPKPWVRTPCILSAPLSRAAGCNIYLKLETLQPSGSFKSRGVGNFMAKAMLTHQSSQNSNPSQSSQKPHFYCSSGGNAGLACITAANTLSCSATIVVPLSTSSFMIGKLKDLGAHVIQQGNHWVEADTYLRSELLGKDEAAVYVPPFDHPDIWEGNSSLVSELEEQIDEGYDGIVCSVGGGGLFCGIMQGLKSHGQLRGGYANPVAILAVETEGADSLSLSLTNGALSRLPAITSIATSLGATQVAAKTYEWALRDEVTNLVLSDKNAAMACVRFADEERILVESACGVSIAPVYDGSLRRKLYSEIGDEEWKEKKVVIVVCGGSNVTLGMLEGFRKKYGQDEI